MADAAEDLARACARLFATPDGRTVLHHLRRTLLERALGPEASDTLLRHREGQRALVLMLEALAVRGAEPP